MDSDSSGIAQPRMVQKVGIRPAVVRHGEAVTVTGEDIESVSVISVSGKSELNLRGKGNSVEVPTSGLGKGVHIVDVTADGTHTSQKVVVR